MSSYVPNKVGFQTIILFLTNLFILFRGYVKNGWFWRVPPLPSAVAVIIALHIAEVVHLNIYLWAPSQRNYPELTPISL